MSFYQIGSDILGDMGTGSAPSLPLSEYGPGAGGTMYTDAATIRAVQTKLKSLGYFSGNADGIFGTATEAALFKFSDKHGPPDEITLAKLGIKPGRATPSVASVSTAPAAMAEPTRGSSFLTRMAFGGMKIWQIGLASVAVVALGAGVTLLAVRR